MATVAESMSGHLGKDVEMASDVERAATGDAGRLDGRVHRTPLANKERNKNDSSTRSDPSENGKKKPKEEKPPSKVVIRRLPPTMTKEVFISQISPVPEHDYFYFVPGDPTAGSLMGFSRAYINFINQDDLFRFTETYDNYVFVDSKGQEFPAIVEFAPFQRIPKQRSKKKDPLSGCMETDVVFIAFKESLEAAAADAAKPDVTSKQHFFETEVLPSAPQEMATTPLLEFLKQKRADRARIRDERKEERKRKEAERKLRQKAIKEKKETEEEHKDIKTSPNPQIQTFPGFVARIKDIVSESVAVEKRWKTFPKNSEKLYSKKLASDDKRANEDRFLYNEDSDKESNKYARNPKPIGKPGFRSRHFSNKSSRALKNDKDQVHKNAKKAVESEFKAKQQTAFLRQMLKLSSSEMDGNQPVTSVYGGRQSPSASPATGDRNCSERPPRARGPGSVKGPLLPTPTKFPPFGIERSDFPELRCPTTEGSPLRKYKTSDSSLLQPKDKKESANKESRNNRRSEKEKPHKEIRPREFRNRSSKNFSEDKPRNDRKEDRKREGGGTDKKDDRKETTDKEVKDEEREKPEESAGNLASERGKGSDRRRGGERKKLEGEGKGGEGVEESAKKNRNERNKSVRKERERKRRDDYLAKKNLEKKNNDGGDRKKSRNSRNGNTGAAAESGSFSDNKDRDKETEGDVGVREDGTPREVQKEGTKRDTNEETHTTVVHKRRNSLELTVEATPSDKGQLKRRNSLESGGFSELRSHKRSSGEKERRSVGKQEQHAGFDDKRGAESDSGGEKPRRSREEKASKSDQDDRKKDEKDTRPARRIRNKPDEDDDLVPTDLSRLLRLALTSARVGWAAGLHRAASHQDRPSIQIYRPGMGKLSKQRLEKEKTLGSSTEVDSPSHSPSPVPKTKPPTPS